MQSIEVVMSIVVVIVFVFGLALGHRGKGQMARELSTLIAKFKATDQALDKALDDIRGYRMRVDDLERSNSTYAQHCFSHDRLMEKLKEHLNRKGLRINDLYGSIEPTLGEDYRCEMSVVRLPQKEIDERNAKRAAMEKERYERTRPVRQTASASPRVNTPTSPRSGTSYARQDQQDDSLMNVAMATAVACSMMDSSSSRQESSPCSSPSYDTDSCSSTSFD